MKISASFKLQTLSTLQTFLENFLYLLYTSFMENRKSFLHLFVSFEYRMDSSVLLMNHEPLFGCRGIKIEKIPCFTVMKPCPTWSNYEWYNFVVVIVVLQSPYRMIRCGQATVAVTREDLDRHTSRTIRNASPGPSNHPPKWGVVVIPSLRPTWSPPTLPNSTFRRN